MSQVGLVHADVAIGNFSKSGIYVNAVEEEKIINATGSSNILHVTAASKSGYSNETIHYLKHNFLMREKTDRDVWLIGQDISVRASRETTNR